MPEGRTGDRGDRAGSRPEALILARNPDEGFRLEGEGGWSLEATPVADGWTVRENRRRDRWILKEAAPGGGQGFSLVKTGEGEPREGGRSSHTAGGGQVAGAISLLLSDGRLFLVLPVGGPDPGFDLVGWEVPGAYWSARRKGDGWRLAPTSAGRELGIVDELLLLFAVEILVMESRSR